MPWINGRFYANALFGRALERARTAESGRVRSEQYPEVGFEPFAAHNAAPGQTASSRVSTPTQSKQNSSADHWVTINGKRVLIHESGSDRAPGRLSARDKSDLDKYYDAVEKLARRYDVDPVLVLSLGIESGFASKGTYLRTGDAFGMTGGSTAHMTNAASPEENVKQFFSNWGVQIRGSGSDTSAFINGLEGRDPSGKSIRGRKVYNTVDPYWPTDVRNGIGQMKRSVPVYRSQRDAQKVTR